MPRKFFLALLLGIAATSCSGRSGMLGYGAQEPSSAAEAVAPADRYTYSVVRKYPHATDCYTQGLVWLGDRLLEGTGGLGESRLRTVGLDGREFRSLRLSDSRFGEGTAVLDGKVYQLTWTSGEAYVYDLESFRRTGIFHYQGEGWGLTTDGEVLYMSDGSSTITVRDPKTFGAVRTFDVRTDTGPVSYLNELEWIDGRIWANVYTTDYIVIIEPDSGRVSGIVDLSGIRSEEDITPKDDVLNGIAYDSESGRIFLTGKYWSRIYEVEILPEKQTEQ